MAIYTQYGLSILIILTFLNILIVINWKTAFYVLNKYKESKEFQNLKKVIFKYLIILMYLYSNLF